MKHFIKTVNGISKEFIQASESAPLSGCGQGNGGGPISWHAHMEPLIQAYAKDNRGFSFQDSAHLISFLQWVVGYVDDNSLILTFRDGESITEVLRAAHQALSSWQKLLQITGGDMALEKMCIFSHGVASQTGQRGLG